MLNTPNTIFYIRKNFPDPARIKHMVERTFGTSKGYEKMKLEFAKSGKPLDQFFNNYFKLSF